MNLPLPGAADIPAADDAESKATPAPTAPQAAADEQPPEALWDDADREEGGETAAREPAEPTVPIRFEDGISGQLDAEVENPEVALPKRVLSPQADTPKLHKVL